MSDDETDPGPRGRSANLTEMARRVYAAQFALSECGPQLDALVTLGEAFEQAAPGSLMDDAAGILLTSSRSASDDDTVTVTRGMLRRWHQMVTTGHGYATALAIQAVLGEEVAETPGSAMSEAEQRAMYLNKVLPPADTSPDPEGGEATMLAPASDTARSAEQ